MLVVAGHLAAALAAIALAPAAAPAAEATRSFTPPVLAPLDASVPPVVRDRVIEGDLGVASTSSRLTRVHRKGNVYRDQHGHRVYVEVSDGYLVNLVAEQALVDFLGSLIHGAELNRLGVYVATPFEIPQICGGIAAACYFPNLETMVIVGEASFGGLPTDYVAAHEYGHHVENHRRNSPWPALGWGTKRWSTYERICPRYLAGKIFPGDRADEYPGPGRDFYWQNPAEAFAEAYAKAHPAFRAQAWDWIGALLPDLGAYQRIRADVANPWKGNRKLRFKGRLRRGQRARQMFAVPLDGKVLVKLSGPKGTDFDLGVIDPNKRLLASSAGRGSREKVRGIACGDRRLGFEVRAQRGAGRFKAVVSKP